MNRLLNWMDIRPDERRIFSLAFVGAFIVVGTMILGRSVREGFYLARFDVKTLPYITAAVSLGALPTVAGFSALLARGGTRSVMMGLTLLLATACTALWPFVRHSGVAVVVFYLLSSLGTLILTSGFWILIAEHFEVRRAKRLFGLVSAGGTLGALVLGTSIKMFTKRVDLSYFVPALAGLLVLFFLAQSLLPRSQSAQTGTASSEKSSTTAENLKTIWRTKHLRWMALVVFTATVASTLLDFQFKGIVRGSLDTKEALAGYFGGFYAWTALAALLVQISLSAQILSRFGLFATLSILPAYLCLGSVAMLLYPGLLASTIVRGGDNSLRKSLYRSAMEVSYVPLPEVVRRRTKSFIDSVIDSLAEGIGSGIIFVSITLLSLQLRWLSVMVLGLSLIFLWLNRKIDRSYFSTLVGELKKERGDARNALKAAGIEGRDLLSATFTRLRLPPEMIHEARKVRSPAKPSAPLRSDLTKQEALRSAEPADVKRALEEDGNWSVDLVPALIRLMARDVFLLQASDRIVQMGPECLPALEAIAISEETDFVIRRRIPILLGRFRTPQAESLLVKLLTDRRFEVRYRSGIALMKFRKELKTEWTEEQKQSVWNAIEFETVKGLPVWEMHQLLDDQDVNADEFVEARVSRRGKLGLEHTFRLLALVLDPQAVRAAYRGILIDDPKLRSFALEFLEIALPPAVRDRLWQFIGDLSAAQKEKAKRPVSDVVSDLLNSHMTVFGAEEDRRAVKKILKS